MKKIIISAVLMTSALIAVWDSASAATYNLWGRYQRSSDGVLSSNFFKAGAAQGCPNSGSIYIQPCYNPANSWTSTNGVVTAISAAGPPTWDWDGTTLTETGLFWVTGFVQSNPNASSVISDKVNSSGGNLTITPGTTTTNAATYDCIEGVFLATVEVSGCKNSNFNVFGDFVDNSSVNYNGGGNSKCVTLTIGGDDYSLLDGSPGVPGTPDPRGLDVQTTGAAGVGCSQTGGGNSGQAGGTSGAFGLWHVIRDDGTVLILADSGTDGVLTSIGRCLFWGPQSTGNPLGGENEGRPCPADPTHANISYLVLVKPGAADTDGDGMPDGLDNCINLANPDQFDGDGDGYGNRCDGDLNNNGATNAQDYAIFRSKLGSSPPDVAADLNHNGSVNAQDYAIFRTLLGLPSGPSGLH